MVRACIVGLRLKTSSIKRFGPTYSIFIFKCVVIGSGMLSWTTFFARYLRLMQSSTRAMRPVAMRTLGINVSRDNSVETHLMNGVYSLCDVRGAMDRILWGIFELEGAWGDKVSSLLINTVIWIRNDRGYNVAGAVIHE